MMIKLSAAIKRPKVNVNIATKNAVTNNTLEVHSIHRTSQVLDANRVGVTIAHVIRVSNKGGTNVLSSDND